MEKKTLSERYADEVLTNNAALNHYSQCKDCIFRDKRLVGGEECGYDKSVTPDFFPYTPIEPGDKPKEVYNNTANCEYYEQEKRKK